MALKMSEPDYLLQSFGICAYSLKNGLSTQMIKDAALKINKLSQSGGSKTWLIDISNQLLPVIEDDKFSPIWLVLLEGLSGLCHQEEVQNVYSQINKKHAKVFVNGSLPKEILHKLWLSHLPCLEFAVVSVVEHVCANQDLPDVNIIHDTLIKSCVAEIASKEVAVYEAVYHMLMSMTVHSDYAMFMIEITAEFCYIVRTMTSEFAFQNWMRNTSMLPGNLNQLETLLRSNPDPETMPSLSIVKTLHEIHMIWKNMETVTSRCHVTLTSEQSSSLHDTSDDTPCQYFEDLWCLTVKYRKWMLAAISNILSCDQQYVEACFWCIAVHYRIVTYFYKFKTLEDDLLNFVYGLRDLLHTTFLYTQLSSLVTPLTVKIKLAVELSIENFKGKEETYKQIAAVSRYVINLLLMRFFFQSDGGFTFGDELVEFVTSSKYTCDHVRCLIYHYRVLNITSKHWSSFKCDLFLSFVNGLCLKLENEHKVKNVPDFVHIYNGLKSLLTDLK